MRWLLLLSSSSFVWVLLVTGIHRESPRTAISAHGFLHSAILQRFWVDGASMPPQNPFFSGEPLPYYWFFHALGALLGGVLGLDPLRSFELLALISIVALVFGCGWLTRALYGSPALGAVAAFLVLTGAHLQAPIVLALRAWAGDPVPADDGTFLWGLAHPLLGHMRLWDPFALYGPLLPFYLNVTSRPLAYSALIFVLLAVHAAQFGSENSWRAAMRLAFAGAFATALNPLAGIPVALALMGAVLALRVRVLERFTGGQRPPPGRVIAALLAGILLGATTFLHVFAAGGSGSPSVEIAAPEVVLRRIGTMLSAGWPLLGLSLVGLRAASGSRRYVLATLLIASIVLCGGAAVLQLPVGNQVTLFHDALILLAVGACGSLLDPFGAPSRRRVLAAFVAFLPVLAVIVFSYLHRPPVPLAFEGRALVRADRSHGARLYQWIRSATPTDSVFVVDPSRPIRAMAGNTLELPALTERTVFTVRPSHYIVQGHASLGRRVEIARQLLAGNTLSHADASLLEALDRPFYLVGDAASRAADRSALELRYGVPDFESGPVSVWRWSQSTHR